MANIDWGTLALGAVVGMGCRKQLRTAAKVAATTVANLAGVAAQAAAQVATETKSQQSPEEEAAQQWLNHMDQQVAQPQGQNTNGQNG